MTLKPGLTAELDVEVTADMTINRTGREGADVLSTPSLLGLMERCAIDAADPHLGNDSVTVGYAVDGLRHLAPTALGSRVQVRAELVEVGRQPACPSRSRPTRATRRSASPATSAP